MLQTARKYGHLRVPRLRIHYRTTHVKTTLISTEELQPWDSQMTIFSCLLQHKGAPIFQIKQPLFWKKRQISASLNGAGYPQNMAPGQLQGSREGPIFCLFFQQKWLFDLKNWGKILLQQIRKQWSFMLVTRLCESIPTRGRRKAR